MIIFFLYSYTPGETNSVKLLLETGVKVYQKVISPAQADVCNFYPSCSHFSQQAIKRYGPLWGSLMASERLIRCNPWAYKNYRRYYHTIRNGKFFDPIENNFIFKNCSKSLQNDSLRLWLWMIYHY